MWVLSAALWLVDIKLLVRILAAAVLTLLFLMAPMIAYYSQPWAPWWLADRSAPVVAPYTGGAAADPYDLGAPIISGRVADYERYQLARAAGFNAADAILATALSIAVNGAGNPSTMSGRNTN